MRYGLRLHVGVDPFSGYILWLRVWWTNKNPILIARYFFDAVAEHGGVPAVLRILFNILEADNFDHAVIPMITQSDPGTENYGIAKAQTLMRHTLNPTLEGTLQHRFMRDHQNVKPEIVWSQMSRRFTQGMKNTLDIGHNGQLYQNMDVTQQ